jgi:hypothetical protein
MAIIINTVPQNISNEAKFNVATDLVEDATHVNLRIRADIYFEGEIKAVVEKPKGLPDFDLGNILTSLNYGIKLARDTGAISQTGSIGVNLITDWSEGDGWDTFTHSNNAITSAINTGVQAFCGTNSITFEKGEIYSLWVNPYISTGANTPAIRIWGAAGQATDIEVAHFKFTFLEANKTTLIMPTASFNGSLQLGCYASGVNFSGTFFLHKITTSKTIVGGALVPYFVVFTEYYETAGVTTIGLNTASKVFRFAPCKGDSIAFINYMLYGPYSLFANKTLKQNAVKFYTYDPKEYFVGFFTEYANIILNYRKDAGAAVTSNVVCAEGWGLVILNIGELMSAVTTSLQFWISTTAQNEISETFIITPDTSQISERVILEFDGLVGGKEYMAFEGMKDKTFPTIRNYYTGEKKNRKPIRLTGMYRQLIETRYKDSGNAEHLKSLMISESVKKLESNYITPVDVTIISDTVKIESSDLFVNRLEIEYEY